MSDVEYLANYKPNQLYVNPGPAGAYATIAADDEEMLGAVPVTAKCRIAVSAFYVGSHRDFGSFKISKMKYDHRQGWHLDSEIRVNKFQLHKIRQFLNIIAPLDLSEVQKTRIALGNVSLDQLGSILASSAGTDLIQRLSDSPELESDIYALASKRGALAKFEQLLASETSEPVWQAFFERNPWIFGHGLNYVFLDPVGRKLEATTTGATFDRPGKRVDALMRTRAEISQFVLIELKRADTPLLRQDEYRPGCYGVSNEVSNAVTQVQKTVYEFAQGRFHERLADPFGGPDQASVYSITPRSYLVVGNLGTLDNEDRATCFELYRRNIHSPEIITFDELFARARCIVENISRATELEEVPF